jgi:hypothetical protein
MQTPNCAAGSGTHLRLVYVHERSSIFVLEFLWATAQQTISNAQIVDFVVVGPAGLEPATRPL